MKTIFDALKITYSEYSYYKTLSPNDKIDYLFELYEVGVNTSSDVDLASKLQDFFNSLKQQMDEDFDINDEIEMGSIEFENDSMDSQPEFDDNVELVDVMIDDNHLMIETNSLKALRYTIYKFFEIGYILNRDEETEKMFRTSKNTKYIRIFKIIDQGPSICLN